MSQKRQRKDWKRQRIIDKYEQFEKRIFIFCEGMKTEPNYFNGIKKYIELNPLYKNNILIEINGTGTNTISLLDFTIDYIARNKIHDADIWLVYDKDSFPAEHFNETYYSIQRLNGQKENLSFFSAWSNQCIEYWFILHFDYYDSDNDRDCYSEYLSEKFKKLGYAKYEKNNPQIFEILKTHGDISLAIRYAKKRLRFLKGLTPTKMAPATTVHNIYIELSKYMPH